MAKNKFLLPKKSKWRYKDYMDLTGEVNVIKKIPVKKSILIFSCSIIGLGILTPIPDIATLAIAGLIIRRFG